MIIPKNSSDDNGIGDIAKYQDVYARLAKDRIIFLAEDITKETGVFISALLLHYNNENENEDIKIYINSNGGDATALCNIYDVMQIIKAPIQTICIGKAYSAAAVLLASGTKGKRFATKHCDIMIHGIQAQYPFSETTDSVESEIEIKALEEHNNLVMQLLARHTGHNVQKVTKDCQRDLYMDAKMALNYRMIDEIM